MSTSGLVISNEKMNLGKPGLMTDSNLLNSAAECPDAWLVMLNSAIMDADRVSIMVINKFRSSRIHHPVLIKIINQ
jgi:hypothetical protein